VRNIEFSNRTNEFQKKLNEDKKKIDAENRLIVPADKTTNLYKMEADAYKKLRVAAVTKDYKKAKDSLVKNMIKEDKKIVEKLEIESRVQKVSMVDAFITLKDHKDNFHNNPKVRLLNPTKSEVGKISKKILENVNLAIRELEKLRLWRNTDEVITWFKGIERKYSYVFIEFDVVEFYPSITEVLLMTAIEWAKERVMISEDDTKIIMQAKRSLLYSEGEPWTKKGEPFDVAMGSFDGAESCELVGLYMLSQMSSLNMTAGLYRDDGLGICRGAARSVDRVRKEIHELYERNGLRITSNCNMKRVNFLDVYLDLSTGTFGPYMKPGNTPLYVHSQSNHPPKVLENIPLSINKRLSKISSSEEMFDQAKEPYQEALVKSGYDFKLKFQAPQPNQNNNKKKRQRNIIYFNPPYASNVSSNIGKKYLKIVDKCFPPGHKLRTIFNRNTMKLSYSCMPSMGSSIAAHNKKILRKTDEPPTDGPPVRPPVYLPPISPVDPPSGPLDPPSGPLDAPSGPLDPPSGPMDPPSGPLNPPGRPLDPLIGGPPPEDPPGDPPEPPLPKGLTRIHTLGGCNCQKKYLCPTPGICQTKSVVYQAEVEEVISKKIEYYTGITGGDFKSRYRGHFNDFQHSEKRVHSTLAGHIWSLKDKKIEFRIKWRFLRQVPSYNPTTGKCLLCLNEKEIIIFYPHLATLNDRSELFSTCLHKAKFLLCNS
jgi:hypothetical protein